MRSHCARTRRTDVRSENAPLEQSRLIFTVTLQSMTMRDAWLYLKNDFFGRGRLRHEDDAEVVWAAVRILGTPAGHALRPLSLHVERRTDPRARHVLLFIARSRTHTQPIFYCHRICWINTTSYRRHRYYIRNRLTTNRIGPFLADKLLVANVWTALKLGVGLK